MQHQKNLVKNITSLLILFSSSFEALAIKPSEKDSSMEAATYKAPRHYIRNCVYLNSYGTPERTLRNKKLASYKFSQSNLGFYFPMYTEDYFRKDSSIIANLHLLVVGNVLVNKPEFSGFATQHVLSTTSLGFRGMYNDGKKSIWFYNISPFIVQDSYDPASTSLRYASILIYNRTVSPTFSYRIGFCKTFLFGNRLRLPLIGFRVGALDKAHLSVMLLRNFSFNFPMGEHFSGSIFIKPFGGLYNFSNKDSLYPGKDSIIQFGRYEFLNGFKLDYVHRNFDFFISTGVTKVNKIAFASLSYDDNRKGRIRPFYTEKIPATLFINFGLTFRFGKAKQFYNNSNMYDVLELNNSLDPGDVNDGPANNDIPRKANSKNYKKLQYADVADLIELKDIY